MGDAVETWHGHSHGIMGVRWVRADTHPMPACRVVPVADAATG
jgi:hypothetical protein